MLPGENLAYLAGIMDGDGYFKLTRSRPRPSSRHLYYAVTIGMQQLWPGDPVQAFAAAFGGKSPRRWTTPGGSCMVAGELHVRKAEAAIKRLLPYLLVKKSQALLLLEVGRLRRRTRRNAQERFDALETIHHALLSLQNGSWSAGGTSLPVSPSVRGYERLGPPELGWTPNEISAYLAGIMDSDGNFRINRKGVPDMLSPEYRINVRCAQVVPSPAVELLATTFGGRLSVSKARKPNCRDLVAWSLYDKAAVPAIERLLPYLIVRKAEAYLLLDLRRLKAQGKKGMTEWIHPNRWQKAVKMRKRCYTTEQIAEFERVRVAIVELHSRRLGPTTPATKPSLHASCE